MWKSYFIVVLVLLTVLISTHDVLSEQNSGKRIRMISGNNQVSYPGYALEEPFQVCVRNEWGYRTPGFPVTFTVVEGNGNFFEGETSVTVQTDDEGIAETTFMLGTSGSKYVVEVTAEENGVHLDGSPILFYAYAYLPPARCIEYVSGNIQLGNAGTQLERPFVVRVSDTNDNPVPDFPVCFATEDGLDKGFFEDYDNSDRVIVQTDDEGLAKIYYTPGRKPKTEYRVFATAASLTGSPVIFVAMTKAIHPFDNVLWLYGGKQYFEIPDANYININSEKEYTIEFWFHQNISKKYNLINKWFFYDDIEYGRSQGWFANLNITNFYFHPDSIPPYYRFDNPFEGIYHSGFFMIQTDYIYANNRHGGHGSGRSSSIESREWNHIAFKFFKNMDVQIYLNGSYFSNSSYEHGDIGTPGIPLNIGGLPPAIDSTLESSINFSGYIDEVRIWNKALSDAQIQLYMKDTLGVEYYSSPDSGLVGYYRFEEIEDLGAGEDGLVNDIRDLTYNANHANIIGGGRLYSPSTDVVVLDNSNVPEEFTLLQNYPNPFNASTTIRYQLPKTTFVTLNVYNTLGQEIEILINGLQPAGLNEVIWNANDLPSGIYIYRLETKEFVKTSKMLLQK